MHVLVDLDGTLVDPRPGILGSIPYRGCGSLAETGL